MRIPARKAVRPLGQANRGRILVVHFPQFLVQLIESSIEFPKVTHQPLVFSHMSIGGGNTMSLCCERSGLSQGGLNLPPRCSLLDQRFQLIGRLIEVRSDTGRGAERKVFSKPLGDILCFALHSACVSHFARPWVAGPSRCGQRSSQQHSNYCNSNTAESVSRPSCHYATFELSTVQNQFSLSGRC